MTKLCLSYDRSSMAAARRAMAIAVYHRDREGLRRKGAETMSTFQAVVVIVAFLSSAYVVGRVLGAYEDARVKSRNIKTWAGLAPIIGATMVSDSGWLMGTYQEREVRARMGEKIPAESGTGYNFELEMMGVPGGHDWRVEYWRKFGVFGEPRGEIKTRNEALKVKLSRAGVIEMIDRLGNSTIKHVMYEKKRNTLVYNEDVRPRLAPTPERFKAQLELLLRLAKVSEQVNPN